MANYIPTIGLEIHAELKTRTKMFCDSANDPEEKAPNVNICPVCMAHPGTLPVINKEAVKHVLKVGLSVGGTLADFTEFDRKNYFYPDIPKGYQISQYKYPLVSGGTLNGVKLTRIHLEEDTASLMHVSSSPQNIAESTQNNAELIQRPSASSLRESATLVNFNRAGIPLMELVTEPVVKSAEEASAFARELQLLLRTLGASDANMEKGEMRVEANVSVAKATDTAEDRRTNAEDRRKDALILRNSASSPRQSAISTLGTKVEIKNLNSFRTVERAIAYEIDRQTKALERGEKVIQETRGWDEGGQKTFSQRLKEESHDYRYFPDPDLPKLKISEIPEFADDVLKATMPELPWEKRARLVREYGVKPDTLKIFIADDVEVGEFFEKTISKLSDKKLVPLAENYTTSDLMGLRKASGNLGKVTPSSFAGLIDMVGAGDLSSRGAKNTLAIMYAEGGEPRAIAEKNNLIQKNDIEALKKIVAEVIATNPDVVADYKSGKTALLQFFVGQGMKASKGSGNPGTLRTLFEEALK